jgi:hypothetical protein
MFVAQKQNSRRTLASGRICRMEMIMTTRKNVEEED